MAFECQMNYFSAISCREQVILGEMAMSALYYASTFSWG